MTLVIVHSARAIRTLEQQQQQQQQQHARGHGILQPGEHPLSQHREHAADGSGGDVFNRRPAAGINVLERS